MKVHFSKTVIFLTSSIKDRSLALGIKLSKTHEISTRSNFKSRTWLSDFTFTFHFHALEKEMATHSSVLTWKIPGTGEPGGLRSMGSHRVGHDWSNLAAAAAATAAAIHCMGFPVSSSGKESTCNAEDHSSIPGLGRSLLIYICYSVPQGTYTNAYILQHIRSWASMNHILN